MGTGKQVIEIMDSTLRDGEQTSGVSFLPHEKLVIARMLLRDVNVDRIEVASARVSDGEKDAVKKICRYAASVDMLHRVEVLGFVDQHKSIDWIRECGGQVINLLAKGSLKHCTQQLKKTPEEHIADIKAEVAYAEQVGVSVNLYLEDWSSGMKDSPEYVYQMMDALHTVTGISRFLLPDTLGILNPLQCLEFLRKMIRRYPNTHFDFHAHNDYDLAVSNSLAAVLSGAKGIHVTVNGLGERSGNAPLASVQVILKDHFHAITHINEGMLNDVSRLVEGYSGIAIAPNTPVVGDYVFTQVAGVHADGDSKDKLYCNDLVPERFGRKREYALGKNSGKANIIQNLKDLGLELTLEQTKAVTNRITQLGDRKELVTQDDLPYIVSDVLKHNAPEDKVKLLSYMVSTSYGLRPIASLKVEINGQEYEADSTGDGQYDAFVSALRKIYKECLNRTFPLLDNYQVTIPPGGRTDALVQTVITWRQDEKVFRTRGLDADQTEAAIKATFKMLNLIEE
uniref:Alpha-isopropylmalate synthase regulatory domain-containing protein n=1 Tax=Prevotella sp. GTC17262 TaxID=3236797 RepID=A0AB33JQS8_9BACT